MLASCLIAIALPLGVGLFLNRINATPTVDIPAPPTPPTPNGYDLYVAAATATVRARPEADPISDKKVATDAKARAKRYSLTRRMAWLNQNSKTFALFEQAQQTPSLAPVSRAFDARYPDYVKLRQLARDKSAQSNTLWMRGDYASAFEINIDTIQMGHDIRRGGALLLRLVGIAVAAIGRGNSGDTLERLSAAQCKSAARRLEKLLATRPKLDQNLTEEKWALQAGLMERFEESDWRESFAPGKKSPLAFLRIHTISKQQLIDGVGATIDREIANARLPYARRILQPTRLNDPFSEVLLPVFNRAHTNEARGTMGDTTLMLQLALRAYKLENGDYPPALKSLVPNYLGAVPTDPFGGGEALRYKRSGKTYKLWSIGPDGVDDGGKPIPPKSAPRKPFAGERPRGPRAFTDFDGKGDVVAGVNTG